MNTELQNLLEFLVAIDSQNPGAGVTVAVE
jgi:hypothetical protein